MPHPSARFNADVILCEDLAKPVGPILTGVGFLDHMIDQLNSHAQIGITLTIANFAAAEGENEPEREGDDNDNESNKLDHHNRHAHYQSKLMRLVGSKLGREIHKLLESRHQVSPDRSSRFCCPLDEALVVCQLKFPNQSHQQGMLQSYTLAPFGKYARQHIGKLETSRLQTFWESLAEQSGLELSLDKVRGENAHHIVESSFKAFSRALRNLLDGVDTTDDNCSAILAPDAPLALMYGPNSGNWNAGIQLQRQGLVERKTKETSIQIALQLDGGVSGVEVSTGIQTLDSFLQTVAQCAQFSLQVSCQGDLWIDEHHTAEDVAIALGQVVNDALGTKAGLNRMWSCQSTCGQSHVEATMDLSNRPDLTHNLFASVPNRVEMAGDLSLEMMEHVLESLVVNARITVHIVETRASEDPTETVQAVAQALGRAFFYCASIDLRRAGSTASSKGTLSL